MGEAGGEANSKGRASGSEAAGPVVADLIQTLLNEERAIGAALQSRALAVISTSGAIVTLLFGAAAVATRGRPAAQVPHRISFALTASMVSLVIATVVGLISNTAFRKTRNLKLDDLRSIFPVDDWNGPAGEAKCIIASAQLDACTSAHSINIIRSNMLIWGVLAEIIGIGFAAWAVIELL